jgi:hypothetical protein
VSVDEDVIGVTAIGGHPGDRHVPAADQVASPARVAMAAVPAEPADADPVAGLPTDHPLTDGMDHSGNLVTRDDRVARARVPTELGVAVAVADAAGLDADDDLPAPRRGDFPVGEREVPTRLSDLDDT